MFICELRRDPPPRSPVQKSNLNQERLVNFLDRIRFFCQRRGQRVHPNRPSLVFLNNRQQELAVNFVKSVFVDFEHLQRGLRRGQINLSCASHLGVVPHPPQQSVRNPRSPSRPAGNLQSPFTI